MNNFVTRTLSSVVYVAVIVSAVLVHPISFALVFGLIAMLAVREFMTLQQASVFQQIISIIAAGCLFAIFWCLCGGVACECLPCLLAAYGVLLMIAVVAELFLKAENPIANWGLLMQSQIMIALPFALMNYIGAKSPYVLLALFIAIWINDAGAYIIGSLMGKRKGGNHKMFPRVSPAKSWEGLCGGVLFTLLAGVVFYYLGWIKPCWLALAVSAIASVAGTLGDLVESLMKRTIGVKDSGRFLPGHGGVLDRFDSLLLATPAICVFLWLCWPA